MFRLEIDTGNEAMRRPGDIADALHKVIAELEGNSRYEDDGIVWDANGNTVGRWVYKLDMTQDE